MEGDEREALSNKGGAPPVGVTGPALGVDATPRRGCQLPKAEAVVSPAHVSLAAGCAAVRSRCVRGDFGLDICSRASRAYVLDSRSQGPSKAGTQSVLRVRCGEAVPADVQLNDVCVVREPRVSGLSRAVVTLWRRRRYAHGSGSSGSTRGSAAARVPAPGVRSHSFL